MEVLVVVAILVILASVASVVVFRYLEESKENVARLTIQKIETAVTAYRISHGDYPESLEVLILAEGNKPAALEEKDLRDPWQRPYIYEPTNLHPQTGKPRISSQGSVPGDPVSAISNW
jgi:type II secretory pathway pseudopilin PulG